MTFKVNVTGFSADDRAATVAGFATAFKLAPEKAQELLSSLPRSIKSKLDAETAERYRQALEKLGLKAEITAEDQGTPVQVPAAPSQIADEEADQPGLPFTIEGRPDFAFLTVKVPAGETIKVEASAMATMDTHMKMKTKLSGGLGRLLTSESIFINEFTAENAPGEIGIAPAAPGDLAHVYLNEGDVLFLQNGAFVACAPDVKLESKWQGLVKGFFSGESFFLIRASGHGDLWFNTYGGMIRKDVDGEYVVDTGNVVAFSEGLDYKVEKFGGYKSLFFSGEGLICRFRGKGRVWIQTRTTGALLSWVEQFRISKKSD
jgi:uncharacterized protein (TIGR00266 family)